MKEKKVDELNFTTGSFKYRKAVHYTLVVSVIFFQILLLVIVYNEIFNEPKLEELEAEIHISEQAKQFSDRTKSDYIAAQFNLQQYLQTKDEQYLVKYNDALDSLNKNIQNLVKTTDKSAGFSMYLRKDKNPKLSVENINSKIDSLRNIEIPPNIDFKEEVFKLSSIQLKDVIDSLNVETSVSVDSVQRKGLLTRLGNAISGNVDVQKEKSNVVLTLRQGKKVSSGSIEEQIENLFQSTNEYYQKAFENYKRKLAAVNRKNSKNNSDFFNANTELLSYSNMLLTKYNDALVSFTNDARKKFQEQYHANKKIRNYAVIGLIFLMVLISILLAFLTRLAFVYEKRLEQAKQKIQQNLNFKNRIVGMISHEIRSPLNIISIYTRGISRQVQDEEVKDSLKSIEATTQSLSLMANQILEFSKNENKKLILNKTTFNLKTELDEILKSLAHFVNNNGNKLVINNTITHDVMLHSDSVKIHQLFYNIIGNANKFTKKGEIVANIAIEKIDEHTQNLKVSIKDNGAGISEKDLKHIFESYHQGKIAADVQNLGAGLGLNLCKEIVELFQGKISVTSKPNTETVVTFNLILDTQNKESKQ
ncbi:HAMP domain-containing histidine kinase [Flavobacterium sp. CBA20B-1]|uniref:sensor histidine kinase n=1 Tax=unclassified Flavobacterium TaxID=196869 RepID=UPI0022252B48|nr:MULTISPECIES: HAMP domain-containing sensor histidine kinase [unclassified Flavobacterium]WCM41248.1 HAMP domain-containing histidine kinase [Flavobacterium sp. CBA20B-1]